ncbi:membrane anchored protein Mac1 [Schizosaccharomyces cryophilus OY26]|uniref:Membrane anchored protein Mac1 n=1 Tax=Schizosaccharomyces cryophilus (strain OY26 / ATCC MYA-4695 / CBS 11777 / NBRC 106824 / NRRL Y48691) TaxID=653667 RepID=S9XDK3_SCHCR|nr:membrane anchored protein Mac1 [Schizosaccharomyces cryophilus OY26]EPY51821.1 membrane anchored protein Mac1 [Schizosaccharomyces cryophilus OY26]
MIRSLLAFLTIIFLLISTALLIIGSVSVPATSKMMLGKVNDTYLGIFGTCSGNGDHCTKTSFGYTVDDSLVQDFYYKGDKRNVLSKVLITHIISAGMSFISACLVFLSIFVVKQGLNIFNILFIFLTTLTTCCAFGVELTLFLPHNTWQSYVVAGAIGSDLLAILHLCFRSVSIGRMHKKNDETTPSNDTVESFSVYKEKEDYPLTMDDKLNNVPATLPKFNDALTSNSELGPPSEQEDSPFSKRVSPSFHEQSFVSPTPSRSVKSPTRDTLSKLPSYDDGRYIKTPSLISSNNFARPQVQAEDNKEYSPHKTGRLPGFPPLNTNRNGNSPAFNSDPFSKSNPSPTSSEDTNSAFFDVNPNMATTEFESSHQDSLSPSANDQPSSRKIARPFAPTESNNHLTREPDTSFPMKQQAHVSDSPVDTQFPHPESREVQNLLFSGNEPIHNKDLPKDNFNVNSSAQLKMPTTHRSRPPTSLNGSSNDLSNVTGVPRPFSKRPTPKPSRSPLERNQNPSQTSLGSAFSGPSMQPPMSRAEMRNPANLVPVSSTLDQLSGNADFELPVRGGRKNRRSDGVSRMIR